MTTLSRRIARKSSPLKLKKSNKKEKMSIMMALKNQSHQNQPPPKKKPKSLQSPNKVPQKKLKLLSHHHHNNRKVPSLTLPMAVLTRPKRLQRYADSRKRKIRLWPPKREKFLLHLHQIVIAIVTVIQIVLLVLTLQTPLKKEEEERVSCWLSA